MSCANCPNPIANPSVNTTYLLTVTSPNGCTATDYVIVTVNPLLVANAGPDATICSGSCATLTASVTGGTSPYTYVWSQQSPPQIFCGGSSSTCSVCPTGTTTYDLIVTDANGCTGFDQVTIIVVPFPVANAGTDKTICLGDCTILNGGGGGTYTWSPATGLSNPAVSNPAACPTVTTNYTLTVSSFTCTATDVVTVFVNPLTAFFTFIANENCMNQTFSFSGSANVPITSFQWDFGDGGTSTLQNPTHIYTIPGQFVAMLTVTDANGCCDVASQLVSVTPSTSAYNQNCCSQSVTYIQNLNPPAGMGLYSFEITGTVINPFPFNLALPIRDTVIIRPGAVCTLQCASVQFGPWGRIIVEPGGTLSLKGTKLTGLPSCTTMWQGIEVWGDPTHTHANAFQQSFQGKLIMDRVNCNSALTPSLIEDAHNAVTLGKFAGRFLPTKCNEIPPKPCRDGDYITCLSGGILNASGKCEFRNNAHNIRVAPYPFPEASFVNGCVFTGGFVFDPGYQIGAATYQYPNPANFYYATANPSGRTSRFGHIWKARWQITSYIGNIFNNAEIGIEIINGKCLITNNTFQNMNRGISGRYYTPSAFFSNKIKSNTFFNTIVQSTNAATPAPVAGIYLSASIGDRISNANNFGAPPSSPFSSLTDALAQTKNPIGIYMSNSSYFKILDNNFYRTGKGISVYNSSLNGGIIQRYTSGDGNFFPRNNNAIFTFFPNSALTIRCNTTDNNLPAVYGVNWDNNIQILNFVLSFPLAPQGAAAPLASQITIPAGNRFDVFPGTSKREIRSKYSYTYYSHNPVPNIEYVPFNSTANTAISNVNIQPQAPGCSNFILCCPTDPCLGEGPFPPNSPCNNFPQRIGDIDQQISSLQTEFDSVFANLDKGQTAQLLSAINSSMDAGQLKNFLLNNSFLSDETLLAFINRTISTPPGIFKDVIIPNSPVSDDVIPALETKMSSLPPGIASQIKDAQSSNAYRTLTNIRREISALQVERQSVVNSILSVLVDNDSTQAINLLEQENTVAADQILLGTYIAFGNLSAAQAKLAGMTAGNAEEQAFLDLQGMILNLELQGKSVFEMDSAQEQLVRNIAAMSNSFLAKENACNLLYLVFNEHCPDPLTTISLREQSPYNVIASGAKQPQIFYLGDNIPNPFNNTSAIPYSLPDGIEKAFINIYDITGKLINGYEVNSKNNKLVISSGGFENGVYLYKLESNGEIFGSKKMVIIKK